MPITNEGFTSNPAHVAESGVSSMTARLEIIRRISEENEGLPVFCFNAGHTMEAKSLLGNSLYISQVTYSDDGRERTDSMGFVAVSVLSDAIGVEPSPERNKFLALVDAEISLLPVMAQTKEATQAMYLERRLRDVEALGPERVHLSDRARGDIRETIEMLRRVPPQVDVLEFCIEQLSAARAIALRLKAPRLMDLVSSITEQVYERLNVRSAGAA